MKTITRSRDYSSYQPTPSLKRQTSSIGLNILNKLGHVWQSVLAIAAGNQEPRVKQHSDRHGNPFWNVYDPVSGQLARFNSEEEVRLWLEQRYYQ